MKSICKQDFYGMEISLTSEDKSVRKRVLDRLNDEYLDPERICRESEMVEMWEFVKKDLAKCLTDSSESCRQLSAELWKKFLNILPVTEKNLVYLIPILSRRLSFQELQEPSEEVRLNYVSVLRVVVEKYKEHLPIYSDDLIAILGRTVTDNYPEIKRESCACIEELARSAPAQFYPRSENLVNPILVNFNHQHHKVRVASVRAIGQVLLYGNSKAMDQVSTPLAQRLFDQSGAVRLAVVEVAGLWFVELRDRYSWWHKLIPLLVTGLHDEIKEIRIRAGQLWHAAGLRYLQENDNDERLKDKLDFLTDNPPRYPLNFDQVKRPNLGCRIIVQENLCKLVGGIVRELGDWLADVRVRSAQLLCVLVINAEENITQYLETLLPAMYRACNDDDPRVAENVDLAAKYMGYFVPPSTYWPLMQPTLEESPTAGHLRVLAAILESTESLSVAPELAEIVRFLRTSCKSKKPNYQKQLLACCQSIMPNNSHDSEENGCDITDDLFVILFTLIATCKEESSVSNASRLLECLAEHEKLELSELYLCSLGWILTPLELHCNRWTIYSDDLSIFRACLTRVPGTITAFHADLVVTILKKSMTDQADPQVRLLLFIQLAEYFESKDDPSLALYKTRQLGLPILPEIVQPALVWTAGRTAEAIRTAAVCCLCAILEPATKIINQSVISIKNNENDGSCKNKKGSENDESSKNKKGSEKVKCNENKKWSEEKREGKEEKEEDRLRNDLKEYSKEDFESVVPVVVSLVDDNAKKTRLYALRAISHVLKIGKMLSFVDEKHVHACYPSVLKRLDDGCDDVRAAASEALVGVWRARPKDYDLFFNKSHVDFLYTTAVVHLDDPDTNFQTLVLDGLMELAEIHPQLLASKIENCRNNFRNQEGLKRLQSRCHQLLQEAE